MPVVFAIALLLSTSVAAPPVARPPSVSPPRPAVAPPAPDPTGDAEFDAINRQFAALTAWLQRKATLGPDERRELAAFDAALEKYLAAHPDHAAALGMQAQAALWLDDQQKAEEAFGRLIRLRPDDGAILTSWVSFLLRRHDAAPALEALEAHPPDLTKFPKAAVQRAECLVLLDRFDEAIAAIDAAPTEPPPPAAVAADLARLRRVATECAASWPAEQELRAKEAAADDLPRVAIMTDRGLIVLELFEDQAPNTTANFISLVEKDFYDGTRFHRVIPGFMAQGGDPNTKPGATGAPGSGGPGYAIADEQGREGARKHFRGSLAMAHRGPNTAGSQFYICFEPTTHLNGLHTVFGRVIEGMDVVDRLQNNDAIVYAEVLRKRPHDYVPETLPEPPAPQAPTPPTGAVPRLQAPSRGAPTTPSR